MMNNMSTLTNAADAVLVLIDIQQKLVAAMPETVSKKVIEEVSVLLKAAELLEIPVLVTEQYPKGLGPTLPALMAHLNAFTPIEKTCFSCTQSAEFMTVLQQTGRRQVILTGMEAHICVLQTALDLHAQGYSVFVVEQAVSSRSMAHQLNGLARMQAAGVTVINMESALFEWLGDAKHPHFKSLSKLIAVRCGAVAGVADNVSG